jgi:transcriptional regulator with XRE-family HTH domain
VVSGISQQHIHHIEAETRNPSLETLDKIAKGLRVNSAVLLLVSEMDDPLAASLMPMVYISLYNSIVPEGAKLRLP